MKETRVEPARQGEERICERLDKKINYPKFCIEEYYNDGRIGGLFCEYYDFLDKRCLYNRKGYFPKETKPEPKSEKEEISDKCTVWLNEKCSKCRHKDNCNKEGWTTCTKFFSVKQEKGVEEIIENFFNVECRSQSERLYIKYAKIDFYKLIPQLRHFYHGECANEIKKWADENCDTIGCIDKLEQKLTQLKEGKNASR